MSVETIHPELLALLQPYVTPKTLLTLETKIVRDLNVTGSDYLDFIADVEKVFGVDLTDFLIGESPQYVSTGLAGLLLGQRKKPVFRDITVKELNNLIAE